MSLPGSTVCSCLNRYRVKKRRGDGKHKQWFVLMLCGRKKKTKLKDYQIIEIPSHDLPVSSRVNCSSSEQTQMSEARGRDEITQRLGTKTKLQCVEISGPHMEC